MLGSPRRKTRGETGMRSGHWGLPLAVAAVLLGGCDSRRSDTEVVMIGAHFDTT